MSASLQILEGPVVDHRERWDGGHGDLKGLVAGYQQVFGTSLWLREVYFSPLPISHVLSRASLAGEYLTTP